MVLWYGCPLQSTRPRPLRGSSSARSTRPPLPKPRDRLTGPGVERQQVAVGRAVVEELVVAVPPVGAAARAEVARVDGKRGVPDHFRVVHPDCLAGPGVERHCEAERRNDVENATHHEWGHLQVDEAQVLVDLADRVEVQSGVG